MIQQRTVLRVADNSGAKLVRCVKVLGGFKKKTAGLGDFIIVSVKELRNRSRYNSKVLKGSVFKALIIKTKSYIRKKNGNFFRLSDNKVVLLNKKNKLIGTRVTTFIPKLLKKKKFLKITGVCKGMR